MNVEYVPKSSGKYNLESIGMVRKAINWAKNEPKTNVEIFLMYSEENILSIIFITNKRNILFGIRII